MGWLGVWVCASRVAIGERNYMHLAAIREVAGCKNARSRKLQNLMAQSNAIVFYWTEQ